MPIVVDTNCLSSVFDKACIDHAEFECRRIRSWNNIPCSAEQVTIF